MKKAKRLVNIFLLVCMVLASGGLLYATMYASSSATMSAETKLDFFNPPSGIRYNEDTAAFEVHNSVGVSWIASEGWVSTLGKVQSGGTPTQNQTTGVWYTATKTATYNIICDIVYDALDELTLKYKQFYNHAFNNGITLLEGGKIEGNGFTLSGFPMRNASKSSALIASNSGIISNVHMTNAAFYRVTADQQSAAILCAVNEEKGLIDGCEVFGDYGTKKFTNLFGIAAENNGTIKDCINNANLANAKEGQTYTAGITEIKTGSNTVNNINNGNITGRGATASTAGIAMCNADISADLAGNVNNGELIAQSSTSGILGGTIEANSVNATNNVNSGGFRLAKDKYPNYYGVGAEPEETPNKAIVWNSELNVFQVYNAAGVSQIAMGKWISTTGLIADVETVGYKRADGDAEYRIMNDITYSETEADFNEGFSDSTKAPEAKGPIINPSGVVDGGGYTLFNFPIRYVGNHLAHGTTYVDYSSALFARMDGTLKRLSLVLSRTLNENATWAAGGIAGIGTGQFIEVSVAVENPITIWYPSKGLVPFVYHIGIPLDFQTTGRVIRFVDCANFISLRLNNNYSSPFFSSSSSNALERRYELLQFIRCVNYGNLSSPVKGGVYGIGAPATNFNAVYNGCINYGDLYNGISGSDMGGIGCGDTSFISTDNFVDCINYGEVRGYDWIGGIMSTPSTSTRISTIRCINYGKIIREGKWGVGVMAPAATGGVVRECKNYGGIYAGDGTVLSIGQNVTFFYNWSIFHGVNGCISVDPTAIPTE